MAAARYLIAAPEGAGPHVLWDTAETPWRRLAAGTLAECITALPGGELDEDGWAVDAAADAPSAG